MTLPRPRIQKSTGILVWVYGVGLAGMLLPFSRGIFTSITPLNLLFAATFLFWGRWPARQVIISGTIVAVISFFVEAAGVNTGLIFGVYAYGHTLGPKLLNTPLIIGLNWFILIYCTNTVSRLIWNRIAGKRSFRHSSLKKSVFVIFSGSLLMVLYDIFLEPAAMRLDMWSWEGGVIPLRNYLAWFFFSLVFHTCVRFTGEEEINRRAMPLFVVQLGFFAVIDIFYLLAAWFS